MIFRRISVFLLALIFTLFYYQLMAQVQSLQEDLVDMFSVSVPVLPF